MRCMLFFLAVFSVTSASTKLRYPRTVGESKKHPLAISSSLPKVWRIFEYGGGTLRIWGSIYNRDGSPRLWQFRYDPIFKPDVKADGALNVTSRKVLGGKWKVSVPILVDLPVARRRKPTGSRPSFRQRRRRFS